MKKLTVTIKSVFDIMTPVTQLFDLYLFLHQRVFLVHYLHSLLVSKNNEQRGPELGGRYGWWLQLPCHFKISNLLILDKGVMHNPPQRDKGKYLGVYFTI